MPLKCWAWARPHDERIAPFFSSIGMALSGTLAALFRGTSWEDMMANKDSARGRKGQVATLVAIAVLLGLAYAALEFYSRGERNKSVAESRGTQLVQALSRFKLQAGKYPDKLEVLVPKQIGALPACPNGDPFNYAAAAGEYTLTCPNVGFNTSPYTYDSRLRTWQG
jgi:hypothetical protein